MKTRAAVLERPGEPLRIAEVDLAPPAPGEVRVRIEACGVCHSDLHALDGNEALRLPGVLGHEACGEVEEVGAGGRLQPGQRVVLSWSPACGACAPCQRGEVHLCRRVAMSTEGKGPLTLDGAALDRFMGLGAFCHRVVVPESMAIAISTTMPASQACLIGCAVMTGFGAAAVRWGESVAVFGCGGVGLAAIQGALVAGAERVLAVDPNPARRAAAQRVGAAAVFEPEAAVEGIRAATGSGVDAAIECVGTPAAMRAAFDGLRPGGRAVVVGLPGRRDVLQIPALALLAEKSIRGSVYGGARPAVDFPRLAALWQQGRLDLATIAGSVRPLVEVNEAIADMRAGTHTRVVLTF